MVTNALPDGLPTLEQLRQVADLRNRLRDQASLLDYAMKVLALEEGVEKNDSTLSARVRSLSAMFRDHQSVLAALRVRNSITHPSPGASPLDPSELDRAQRALDEGIQDVCEQLPTKHAEAILGRDHFKASGGDPMASRGESRMGSSRYTSNTRVYDFEAATNSSWLRVLPTFAILLLLVLVGGIIWFSVKRPQELENASQAAEKAMMPRKGLDPAFSNVEAVANIRYVEARQLDQARSFREARETYLEVSLIQGQLDKVVAATNARDAIDLDYENTLLFPLWEGASDIWQKMLSDAQGGNTGGMAESADRIIAICSLYTRLQTAMNGASESLAGVWQADADEPAPHVWREACLQHASALDAMREKQFEVAMGHFERMAHLTGAKR